MMDFLRRIAADLYEKTDGEMQDITLVFPTKRAGLFFNQHLADIAGKAMWGPSFTTLNEMFRQLSDSVVADIPLLIFHLYAAYQQAATQVNGEPTNETIDEFYSWGEVMLSDFEDIDSNLSDATQVFRNLKELDDLTSTDYITEEQVKAIERYFGYFNKESKLKERFLSIWNLLYPTFTIFKQRLRDNGLTFEGMLKRDVIESDDQLEKLTSAKYVFVGMNVLTEAETRLMERLKEQGKALFYWDYDLAYLKSDSASFFEAGTFVKKNIERFGSELPIDDCCYDHMRRPKRITYVEGASNSGQTRYAGKLLQQLMSADTQTPLNKYALVLCNEQMLQPMLHALPSLEGTTYKLNVTMGFPLFETPIASFVMMLLDLQVFGQRGNNSWNYKQVMGLLRHPNCMRMAGQEAKEKLKLIRERHLFFIPENLFTDNPFLSKVFEPQNSVGDLLSYLTELVQAVGKSYFDDTPDAEKDFDRQLYEESVYNVWRLTNRIRQIYEQVRSESQFQGVSGLDLRKETVIKLVRQMLQGSSVPFHGEPAEGIQIIGELETRCLDFRYLIMLGMEDENMPKAIRKSSFIPYTLREAYGLTTFDKQSSIHAYGFYRLMQRAEHVTLMFNSADSDLSKGEMSRYMTQMLVEKDRIFNPNTIIERLSLESRVMSYPLQNFRVEKTDEMMDMLKASLKRKGKFFSPTAINTYIDCPFRFYLERIARLRKDDDIEEEVGDDVFGTIFHACMEQIYGPLRGHVLESSDLIRMRNDGARIERMVDDAFRHEFFKISDGRPLKYNGEQELNRRVIVRYVKKQLELDSLLCPLRIEAVENKEHTKVVDIDGFPLRLGGIIDRIDTVFVGIPGKESRRIVDYKTSAKAQTFNGVEDLFNPALSHRPYHILQTFYYADIYTDFCQIPVAPALNYIKPANLKDAVEVERDCAIGTGSASKKIPITDFSLQFKAEFHERLVNVLEEVFNKDVPFNQTDHEHNCTYCDFKELCNRTGEKHDY